MSTNPHQHSSVIRSIKKDVEEVKAISAMAPKVVPMQEEDFDLDQQLEMIAAKVATTMEESKPEPEATVADEGEPLRVQILELLHNHPNAPSVAEIEAWKKKYGNEAVQVIALDPDNIYIYTFLTNSQWDKINQINQSLQGKENMDVMKMMTEAVVRTAVLWPRITPQWFTDCRAGLPRTLYESILISSYFLTPQQALTLTTRL